MFSWQPNDDIIKNSRQSEFLHQIDAANYEEMAARARREPEWLWEQVIRFGKLQFYKSYSQIMDDSRGAAYTEWCIGGTTNIALNCIDRYRSTAIYEKEFLIAETEYGKVTSYTYKEFDEQVCLCAGGLQKLGIISGDVVAMYMPNIPQTFIAYFAIVKMGAIVMPLFSGFSQQACITRLELANAKAVITTSYNNRRGEKIPMKEVMQGCANHLPLLKHIIYVDNCYEESTNKSKQSNSQQYETIEWHQLLANGDINTPTQEMAAMAPAVLHYTSGTTGNPKGCVYTHIGLVTKMLFDHGVLTDFSSSDRHLCMADMGWMVGSKSATIAAINGGSMLVAEGLPDYPQPGRFWRLIQDHKVTWCELSPALIRAQMRHQDKDISNYDISSLRIIVSGGEPWTDAAWDWLFELCNKKVPILNSAGGTEVSGSILLCDLHHPLKRGGFSIDIPGMGADIRDKNGNPVETGAIGELVMTHSSIGLTTGLWQEPQRYIKGYWQQIPGYWTHGDLVSRDKDGYWFIHGRSDDIIKVSGKRIGPAEIENAIMNSGKVAECAVVGIPSDKSGNEIVAVYVPNNSSAASKENGSSQKLECKELQCKELQCKELEEMLINKVSEHLGKSFRPSKMICVTDLPKTRNMKIMRRMIKSIIIGDNIKDTSSLINPQSLQELKQIVSPYITPS